MGVAPPLRDLPLEKFQSAAVSMCKQMQGAPWSCGVGELNWSRNRCDFESQRP